MLEKNHPKTYRDRILTIKSELLFIHIYKQVNQGEKPTSRKLIIRI